MTDCETFHDLLHEYLDDTLDTASRDFSSQHLRHCDACRGALRREQIFAKALSLSLENATAGIFPRPRMRQNVIQALEPKPAAAAAWRLAWESLLPFRIPAAVLAALVGVILLFLRIQFRQRDVTDSSPRS